MTELAEITNNGEEKSEGSDFEFAKAIVNQAGELIRASLSEGSYTTEWKAVNTTFLTVYAIARVLSA